MKLSSLIVMLLLKAIGSTAFLTPSSQTSTRLHTALHMGIIDNLVTTTTKKGGTLSSYNTLEILDEIGKGSYGTVHRTTLIPKTNNYLDSSSSDKESSWPRKNCIAKRAWTLQELQKMNTDSDSDNKLSDKQLKELAERCKYYLNVERHCLEKLNQHQNDGNENDQHESNNIRYVPKLLGEYPDNHGLGDWLVFDLVESTNSDGTTTRGEPAKTLQDVLELDWIDQHNQQDDDDATIDPSHHHHHHHHLYMLQKEMNMSEQSTFANVLDETILQLLQTISHVNNANIVHRDIKPGNLLVTSNNNGFVLIDFGSAADLDPPSKQSVGSAFSSMIGGGGGRVGLEDDGCVALSPIYSAPEVYIKLLNAPTNFDSFSTALVFCQLLFNLLDERSDASFRGQLEDVDYDLDSWLQREINAELRPEGIEDAMKYLASRPGLWSVLRGMLHPDPERRLSTSDALRKVNAVLAAVTAADGATTVDNEVDGTFFSSLLESFDFCALPDDGTAIGVPMEVVQESSSTAEMALVTPYPLHYVATFSRSKPLGLILSEVDPDGKYEDELSEEDDKLWVDSTANAQPGEVYIRGVVEGSQADTMDIFEVGDRVMGVGEFPFIAEGFDTIVEMLQRQPKLANSVTLHFDRKPGGRLHAYETAPLHSAKVVGQGAWSACGRRKYQEDRFVLQEIQDGNNAALLAGVFDGHGGDAASKTLAQLLPSLFSIELAGKVTDGKDKATSADLRSAMESAYDIACRTYRDGCDELETCVADYDPREGIILAAMGASDVIAGSTATMAVLSVSENGADELSVLNCGDSRTLVIGKPRGGSSKDSVVYFSTRDHSPSCDIEIERLSRGKDKGFSQPICRMGRWRIKVGDFTYGLARSLEGSFTTSKGIVSDPDVSAVNLTEMFAEREQACIIIASDGLFEVIDNEECGRYAVKCREEGLEASLTAKQLTKLAIEKGSPDNVSCVVVYID